MKKMKVCVFVPNKPQNYCTIATCSCTRIAIRSGRVLVKTGMNRTITF